MKKKKETLQEQLNKRKFKRPNPFLYWIYFMVMAVFTAPRFKPHYVWKDDIRKAKGPAFLIWNHQSRLDHMFLMRMAYPRRLNILAGYNEFFRSHLHWAFKMNQIIPKKMYANDLISIKGMSSIIKQKGIVCFSPEGTSSIFGDNQPIVPSTGKFLKHYGIPVYCCDFKGGYLTNHKVCLDERYGKIEVEMKLLFSPEDLKNMDADDIQRKIDEQFHHDDYEWNKTAKVHYKTNGNIASHYEDIIYKCPNCGAELHMKSDKDTIFCEKCGNGMKIDEYYTCTPLHGKDKIFDTPTKWVLYERKCIIDEIRKNPNYSFSFDTEIGYLPPYEYVKDLKVAVPCGKGTVTIDHEGFHFVGTKLGEPWSFDTPYTGLYTFPIEVDVTEFGLFVNGDFYEFMPHEPVVGKAMILVQEMHRLHVNEWKNFPWLNYLYEDKEK